MNSVCWGPYEFGLILACGSSDGAISLLTFTGDQQWDVKKISNAHTVRLTNCSECLKCHFSSILLLCSEWMFSVIVLVYSEGLCILDVTHCCDSAADWLQRCKLGSCYSSRQFDWSAIGTEAKLRQALRLRRLRQPGQTLEVSARVFWKSLKEISKPQEYKHISVKHKSDVHPSESFCSLEKVHWSRYLMSPQHKHGDPCVAGVVVVSGTSQQKGFWFKNLARAFLCLVCIFF